jgi:hypothetical protein
VNTCVTQAVEKISKFQPSAVTLVVYGPGKGTGLMPPALKSIFELARRCESLGVHGSPGASTFNRIYRVVSGVGTASLSPELSRKYGVPVKSISAINHAPAQDLQIDKPAASELFNSSASCSKQLQVTWHPGWQTIDGHADDLVSFTARRMPTSPIAHLLGQHRLLRSQPHAL